jgi:hypothetical protein
MRYLLNAPVLTGYGEYLFEGPLSMEFVRGFQASGPTSAIGHEATARFLRERTGSDVQMNRRSVRLLPGDSALVLRLCDRLPEGLLLDDRALARKRHEFGLLTRIG